MMLREFVTGREIREGYMLPQGWGVAWWSMHQDAVVAYPIPLNLLAAAGREFWFRLRRPMGSMSKLTAEIRQLERALEARTQLNMALRERLNALERRALELGLWL